MFVVSYTMLSFSQQLKKPGSHREQCSFPNRCENETSCGQQYISCKDGEMIMPPEKVRVQLTSSVTPSGYSIDTIKRTTLKNSQINFIKHQNYHKW